MNAKSRNTFARHIPPATPEEFINQARGATRVGDLPDEVETQPEPQPPAAPPVIQLEAVEPPAQAPAPAPAVEPAPAPAPRAPRRSPPTPAQIAAPANPWDALDDAEVPLFQPIPADLSTTDEKQFSAYTTSAEHFMIHDTLRHLPNTSLRKYAREALLMRINFDRERLLKLHGKKA